MSISDYIAAQRENISSIGQLPHFSKLGDLTDKLYERAVRLVPKSSPTHFGQLLLICHKSFLSALTLIGQAQPDDAAPISRRAIETTRLALAIKFHPDNAKKWLAYEQRMERWKARNERVKPKPLKYNLDLPPDHLIMNELEKYLGILSDIGVHFTPEYLGLQNWNKNETRIKLGYFTAEQRGIKGTLILLIGIHGSILRIFDECYDGLFFSDDQWKQIWTQLVITGKPLAEPFNPDRRIL